MKRAPSWTDLALLAGLAAGAWVPSGLLAGGAAMAAASSGVCGMNAAFAAHRQGLALQRAAKWTASRRQWRGLAEAGWPPAQSRLARLLAEGRGGPPNPGEAAFWAALAAGVGDGEARALLDKRGLAADPGRLAAWRPAQISCPRPTAPKLAKNAPPAEILQALRSDFHLSYRLRLDEKERAAIRQGLRESLAVAAGEPGAAREPGASRFLVSLIEGFEIVRGGDRNARYVGWAPTGRRHLLRLAWGNFNDQSPVFLARAMLWAVKRRIYDQLPGSTLLDPYRRKMAGKMIVGSIYPDIRNDRYFAIVEQAFRMVEKLPASLRRFIDIIDEIHYNPHSRHYVRRGTVDSTAAYYNRTLSHEGYRLIFFRRDVLYSSPLFFLRSFVHEGTHALQDKTAWRYNREVPKLRARLKRLEAAGKGNSKAAGELRAEAARKYKYVDHWYRRKKTPTGRIPDMAFECEATLNELETVRAAGGGPAAMNDSAYVKLCPEVLRRLNRWRNAAYIKSRRR